MTDCARVPILRIGEHPTFSYDCSQDQTARRLYDDAAKSTAYITDGRHSGSGFFIDDGSRLVTNAHVVRLHYSLFEVRAHDGTTYNARIERYDNLNDLAILKLEQNRRSPNVLRLGSSADLKPDTNLYGLGYPGGRSDTYMMPGTFKTISSISDYVKSQPFRKDQTIKAPPDQATPYKSPTYQTIPLQKFPSALEKQRMLDQFSQSISKRVVLSMGVERGVSGGPVVDENSRAIGVLSNVGREVAYAVPSDMVHTLLTDTPRFEFKYEDETRIRRQPIKAALGTALYGAGFAFAPTATTAFLGVLSLTQVGTHIESARSSSTTAEQVSSALKLTADAAFIAGTAFALSSKLSPLRNAAAAIGASTVAADWFVPSNPYLAEIIRTDARGDRAPFEWNPKSAEPFE